MTKWFHVIDIKYLYDDYEYDTPSFIEGLKKIVNEFVDNVKRPWNVSQDIWDSMMEEFKEIKYRIDYLDETTTSNELDYELEELFSWGEQWVSSEDCIWTGNICNIYTEREISPEELLQRNGFIFSHKGGNEKETQIKEHQKSIIAMKKKSSV